jgi:membrane protease YdiL (CAAX protease family)
MGAVGLAWAIWAHGSALKAPHGPLLPFEAPLPLIIGSMLALLLVVMCVSSTRFLVHRTAFARQLHLDLRSLLLGLSTPRIALLAGLSAVAEELLFRAALQPSIGLLPASIVFGLMHVGPGASRLAWPLWATCMGLCFGLLCEVSGHLLPAVVAHALINYENMQYICNYDPTPLDMHRRRPHASRKNSRVQTTSDA